MVLIGKSWHDRDVATAVAVKERTVRPWKQPRRAHGLKSLWRDERGRAVGEGRTLSPEQEKEVRTLLADKMPDQLKVPFALWTRQAVAQLLELRFGLKLPVRTMGEDLKRWGFTPQQPIQKADEQNPGKFDTGSSKSIPPLQPKPKPKEQRSIGATRPG